MGKLTAARSALHRTRSTFKEGWLKEEVGRRGRETPWVQVGHSHFSELPPKTKPFWRGLGTILKRKEGKSGRGYQRKRGGWGEGRKTEDPPHLSVEKFPFGLKPGPSL